MTDRIEQFTHPAASPASNTQFDVLDAWRNDSTRYLAQVEFTGTPTRTFDSSSQSIIGDTTLSGNSADQSLTQSGYLSDATSLLASLTSAEALIAAKPNLEAAGIPQDAKSKSESESAELKKQNRIDEEGNWKFQNPDLKPGQDVAGALKEWLWNNFNPSPAKVPENNVQFLYQFLTGTGKTVQAHTNGNDPVLRDFMHSPGADAIRKEFAERSLRVDQCGQLCKAFRG